MRTTFENCSNVAVTKFRPRFRADTLTFLLSLWKLRASGIRIYFENESTSSCALEKYTWYRATRCGVNPKSNRSAVKFRARARYMQSGTSRTWKTDVEEATRNEQDECRRKKRADGKTNKEQGRRGIGVSERSIPEGKGYQCSRLQCPPPPKTRQKSFQVKRHDRKARLLRRLKVPFTYRAKTRRGWRRGEKRCGCDLQDAGRGGKSDGNRGSKRGRKAVAEE